MRIDRGDWTTASRRIRKDRFSTPSDKSDGSFFTKPEGFRVLKDVPARRIGCIKAGWPASLMEHRGGLGLQSMACFFSNPLLPPFKVLSESALPLP